MLVVVLVVTMMLSHCSPSKAQLLDAADAAALFDLCDRPGNDLWPNCSDSANACTNTSNWGGVLCDPSKTAILNMYDTECVLKVRTTDFQLTFYQIANLSRLGRRITAGVDR